MRSFVVLSAVAAACLAALPTSSPAERPASVAQTCSQWNVTGTWTIRQANLPTKPLTWKLTQQGTTVSGSAVIAGTPGVGRVIRGSLVGSRLDLVVQWPSGSRGLYGGTVTAGAQAGSGQVRNGLGWDLANPSAKVAWTGSGPASCVAEHYKTVKVDYKYRLWDVVAVYSPSPECNTTPNRTDQDWPGMIGPDHGEAIVRFSRRQEISKHHHSYTGAVITSGGLSEIGAQPFDLDKKGHRVFPTIPRCRGTQVSYRMVNGTQSFEVTPSARIFTTKVQVQRSGVPGAACRRSVGTLRVVDSDVHLQGFDADSISITGWSPPCPHVFSYSMTAPTAAPGSGTSVRRPQGFVGVELWCVAPAGSGRGNSPKECDD